ncbi:uncharacterized protein LOC113218111 [Frankliniella occidentalis]|uniref:ATP-dependent DNA helicase n=1 Tax=Frankliniella occidentalis TaxID=133901 RepID=A0A9C6XU39_FRAOC|nr:uncharacterized protein LOC113218111 [Frankliniella occidentalis]
MMRDDRPKLVRVEGPAASGKSNLIQEMAMRTRLHYEDDDSVLVLALTNAAADAIGGRTFHRALALPTDTAYEPLRKSEIKALGLRAVRVVLIDNFQQCNTHILKAADRRFRQASSENGDEPFGGRIVVACGDSSSWGPVPSKLDGKELTRLQKMSPAVQLRATYFSSASFGAAMARLGHGDVTQADRLLYKSRLLTSLPPEEQKEFLAGPRVIVRKDDRGDQNNSRAKRPAGAGARSYRRAGNDPRWVTLWPGAPVVLTTTLEDVAEAGSQGVVRAVSSSGVEVEFEEDAAASVVPNGEKGLPLAAPAAYTVPTVQGLRFDKLLVELPTNGWGRSTLQYAALTRAKGWTSLAFKGPMTPQGKRSYSWHPYY